MFHQGLRVLRLWILIFSLKRRHGFSRALSYSLSPALLNLAVGGDGAQRHSGEHGAQERHEHDQERLPNPSASHNVEEPQKDEHTCMQRKTATITTRLQAHKNTQNSQAVALYSTMRCMVTYPTYSRTWG